MQQQAFLYLRLGDHQVEATKRDPVTIFVASCSKLLAFGSSLYCFAISSGGNRSRIVNFALLLGQFACFPSPTFMRSPSLAIENFLPLLRRLYLVGPYYVTIRRPYTNCRLRMEVLPSHCIVSRQKRCTAPS